jgi:Protein of unknown function (DUF2924)
MNGLNCRRRPRGSTADASLDHDLDRVRSKTIDELRALWREIRRDEPPLMFSKDLLARALAHQMQEDRLGGLPPPLRKMLASVSKPGGLSLRRLKVGAVIVREYQGTTHEVIVVSGGFGWQGTTYASLSAIALKITGTKWNGPRFFGLRGAEEPPAPHPLAQGPSEPKVSAGSHLRRGNA